MGNRKIKFFLVILLSLALIVSLFSGCKRGDDEGEVAGGEKDADEEHKDNEEKNQGEDEHEDSDKDEPVTITYWAATSPESADVDPKNLETFKEVEKRTNVDIEWIHIPEGTESEQFQLMMLSDKLPDVIFYKWRPGGLIPDKAIADEVIIPINDLITEHAPNYNKLLDENPELVKLLKTDSGHFYCFPYIRGLDMWDRAVNGLQMRKDWLDDLNLEIPKTIDDWYRTLKAFKDQKGAQIPFGIKLGRLGFITAAWGFDMTNFAVDEERLIYSPIEPEYKEMLETLRKWVDEGLLVLDPEELGKEIIAGEAGAWQAGPGHYIEEGKESDPNFDVISVTNPALNEGDTPYIFPRWPYEGMGAAISAHCPEEKHEAIARWLDFSYSEEGNILDLFGLEGIHYTWKDDKVMPTDIMFDPEPEGLTPHQYQMRHLRPKNARGPYLTGGAQNYLHEDALNKDPNYPYKAQAVDAWGAGDPSRTLPTLYMTAEETEKLEDYSEMWQYVSDMLRKFISGDESLDNFDRYVEEAKRLGAEEIVSIYQAALDRYNAR